MLQPQKKLYTPDEYFVLEEQAPYKSEYYHGEIFAMAGGTPNHNQIAVNMITAFNTAFRDTSCRVFTSDMRVQIAHRKHYVYPDVTVVCGKLEFAEDRRDMITNPLLIVEVLSEGTKDYDRGSKFTAYRKIPTLQEYILIDQAEVHIEHFHKQTSGEWVLKEYLDLEDTLEITTLQLKIPLSVIYERAEW